MHSRRPDAKRILAGLAVLAAFAGGCGDAAPDPPPTVEPSRQPGQSAPSTRYFGFDTASPGLGQPIPGDAEPDMAEARKLGANLVRLTIRWDRLQPAEGPLDPAMAKEIDRAVKAASKEGLGVLLLPLFTPCWAWIDPLVPTAPCPQDVALYPPRDPATYGEFVRKIVDRWGKHAVGVEAWNEPNHRGFWLGTPQQYLELVQQASAAVRSSRYADLTVVGGATSGVDLDYLKQLLDGGIAEWTDAISVHPYDLRLGAEGWGDPSVAREGDRWSYAWAVPAARELMLAAGDEDPIWITEFGYPDCPGTPHCVSAEAQADYLRKGAELTAQWPYVEAFLVYRLRDWVPQTGSMEGRFGVLNQDRTPKTAAAALAEAFRSLQP